MSATLHHADIVPRGATQLAIGEKLDLERSFPQAGIVTPMALTFP